MSDTLGPAASEVDAHGSAAGIPLAGRLRPAVVAKTRRAGLWQALGPVLVFAGTLLVVSVLNPAYLHGTGISIVTEAAAPIMLVALGQAMVLNIGSIDLSNAAISLFGAILLALTLPTFGVAALLGMLVVVTVLRAVNGAIVA